MMMMMMMMMMTTILATIATAKTDEVDEDDVADHHGPVLTRHCRSLNSGMVATMEVDQDLLPPAIRQREERRSREEMQEEVLPSSASVHIGRGDVNEWVQKPSRMTCLILETMKEEGCDWLVPPADAPIGNARGSAGLAVVDSFGAVNAESLCEEAGKEDESTDIVYECVEQNGESVFIIMGATKMKLIELLGDLSFEGV